ncbi:MAG: hypothetical protein RSB82_00860 [Victivallaceae bacterium]
MNNSENTIECLMKARAALNLHNVWFASTLSLSRNFSNFKFKDRLTSEQCHAIDQLVLDTCRQNPGTINNPVLIKTKDLTPWQKEIFLEHFLFNQGLSNPEMTAFIKDDSMSFCIALNVTDHVILHLIDFNQDLENNWSRLNQIDSAFHKQVGFAFADDFGFLTTNPKYCGTGLSLGIFLHLPLLFELKKFNELIEEKNELTYANFDGEIGNLLTEPLHFPGNIVMIRNSCSLGLTEENIISSIRIWCTKAMVAELGLRKTLLTEDNQLLKDKVMRALGLITHSYQLELSEALNAFSLIKLGLEIGWLENKDNTSIITQAFWNIRRAYLMVNQSTPTNTPNPDEITKIRSKYLRDLCSKVIVKESAV